MMSNALTTKFEIRLCHINCSICELIFNIEKKSGNSLKFSIYFSLDCFNQKTLQQLTIKRQSWGLKGILQKVNWFKGSDLMTVIKLSKYMSTAELFQIEFMPFLVHLSIRICI